MTEDYFKKRDINLPSINDADNQDNPLVVAHFQKETNLFNTWHWYVIGGDPLENGDYYLYTLVDGIYLKLGMATLNELLKVGAELDVNWKPDGLYNIKEKLSKKK